MCVCVCVCTHVCTPFVKAYALQISEHAHAHTHTHTAQEHAATVALESASLAAGAADHGIYAESVMPARGCPK